MLDKCLMLLHTYNARKKPNERGLYLQAIWEPKPHEISSEIQNDLFVFYILSRPI